MLLILGAVIPPPKSILCDRATSSEVESFFRNHYSNSALLFTINKAPEIHQLIYHPEKASYFQH